MKTEYKHIRFEKIREGKRTSEWNCMNKSGQYLGTVMWYFPWRQYCFYTDDGETYFSGGCLNDIKDFMLDLRKHELEARRPND